MNRIHPRGRTARRTETLLLALALTAPVALPVAASESAADSNLHNWLLRRLNEPTPRERAHEQSGNVYVYDGLTDRDVERAMNSHFDRIEYMMFVGTRRTAAESSEAATDASGEAETESPGCGD